MKFQRGDAVLVLILCASELWGVTTATLSKSDRGKKKKKNDEVCDSGMTRSAICSNVSMRLCSRAETVVPFTIVFFSFSPQTYCIIVILM